MKVKLAIVAGFAVLTCVNSNQQLQAAAAVYESFNYTSGHDITTVTSTATGLGNWGSSTGTILGTTDSTGLTFGSLATAGGSLDVSSPGNNNWQFVAAPITNSISDGSTLYASYLIQYNGAGGSGSADNFGVSTGTSSGADHTMALLAQAYLAANSARIGYADNQNNQFATTANVFDGNTYMFIGKWTNLGGTSTGIGWVLSQANFNAISGSPITETALNNNNVGSGTFGPATAGSFNTSQFVKIGDFLGGAINYKVDELRFGTALTDVAPVSVPEPSSYVFLSAGGIGLYLLRRKKGLRA